MEKPIRQRRRVIAAALIIGALAFTVPATAANAHQRSDVSSRVCDIPWQRGTHHVKRLIRCATRQWHVDGGAQKALSIAGRESHYRPHAYNASGAAGIYQQLSSYWPGRARAYGFPGWSVFNARANVIVSIRMAHRQGWNAWGG